MFEHFHDKKNLRLWGRRGPAPCSSWVIWSKYKEAWAPGFTLSLRTESPILVGIFPSASPAAQNQGHEQCFSTPGLCPDPEGLRWIRAAAAAKSLQSCPTLCDPIDGSLPGSPVPGILQARTLEWVAIAFSNAWKWKVKVKSLSRDRLLVTPRTAAHQAPPPMGFSRQEFWSGVPSPSPLSLLPILLSLGFWVNVPCLVVSFCLVLVC